MLRSTLMDVARDILSAGLSMASPLGAGVSDGGAAG